LLLLVRSPRCRRLGVFEILIGHFFLLLNPTGGQPFSSLQFKQQVGNVVQASHPRDEPIRSNGTPDAGRSRIRSVPRRSRGDPQKRTSRSCLGENRKTASRRSLRKFDQTLGREASREGSLRASSKLLPLGVAFACGAAAGVTTTTHACTFAGWTALYLGAAARLNVSIWCATLRALAYARSTFTAAASRRSCAGFYTAAGRRSCAGFYTAARCGTCAGLYAVCPM
jgi:hypothetical protein